MIRLGISLVFPGRSQDGIKDSRIESFEKEEVDDELMNAGCLI